MRTGDEISRTPAGLLTEEEINTLDAAGQEYARNFQARVAREAACPGHERIETASLEESRRGWHRGECKHCGKNMTYDSGD